MNDKKKDTKNDTLESLRTELTDSRNKTAELEAAGISAKATQESLQTQLDLSAAKVDELGVVIAEKDVKLSENAGTSKEVIQAKAESLSKDKEITSLKIQIESYKSQVTTVTDRLQSTTSELNKIIATKGFKKGADLGIDNDQTFREKLIEANANLIR